MLKNILLKSSDSYEVRVKSVIARVEEFFADSADLCNLATEMAGDPLRDELGKEIMDKSAGLKNGSPLLQAEISRLLKESLLLRQMAESSEITVRILRAAAND